MLVHASLPNGGSPLWKAREDRNGYLYVLGCFARSIQQPSMRGLAPIRTISSSNCHCPSVKARSEHHHSTPSDSLMSSDVWNAPCSSQACAGWQHSHPEKARAATSILGLRSPLKGRHIVYIMCVALLIPVLLHQVELQTSPHLRQLCNEGDLTAAAIGQLLLQEYRQSEDLYNVDVS
jgi:hypothetical protein